MLHVGGWTARMTKHPLGGARRVSRARTLRSHCSRGFLREDVYEIVLSYRCSSQSLGEERLVPTERAIAVMTSRQTDDRGLSSSSGRRASLRTQTRAVTIIDTSNVSIPRAEGRKLFSSDAFVVGYTAEVRPNRVLRSLRVPSSRRIIAPYASPSPPPMKNHPHRRVTGGGSTSRSGVPRPSANGANESRHRRARRCSDAASSSSFMRERRINLRISLSSLSLSLSLCFSVPAFASSLPAFRIVVSAPRVSFLRACRTQNNDAPR